MDNYQLNDPDFDQAPSPAPEDSPAHSFFPGSLPPKVAFWVGVIGGVLVIGTIGFFVLVGIVLKAA